MIKHKPVTIEIIEQLYNLACTPFVLRTFRYKWEAFGWNYVMGDEYWFEVQVPGYWGFNINPSGKNVLCANLPFCSWETYSRSDHHNSLESWNKEQARYDDIYEVTRDLARQVLPTPLMNWRDQDKDGHQAVVWEGDYGLLILQQACLDLQQYGLEINFWLDNSKGSDFKPETPLIDWLCLRDSQFHPSFGSPLDWG